MVIWLNLLKAVSDSHRPLPPACSLFMVCCYMEAEGKIVDTHFMIWNQFGLIDCPQTRLYVTEPVKFC